MNNKIERKMKQKKEADTTTTTNSNNEMILRMTWDKNVRKMNFRFVLHKLFIVSFVRLIYKIYWMDDALGVRTAICNTFQTFHFIIHLVVLDKFDVGKTTRALNSVPSKQHQSFSNRRFIHRSTHTHNKIYRMGWIWMLFA